MTSDGHPRLPEKGEVQSPPPFVEMSDLVVKFGSLTAVDHINLSLEKGRVQALLGENGAGKTTLMRVLAGLTRPQSGQITIGGRPVRLSSPSHATECGVAMVHQHFMLVETLTVAQNVCLGVRRAGYPVPHLAAVAREVAELGRLHNLDVDPHARVSHLSVGVQQRVEIIKALYRNAQVLILDEPTSVLTPQEADSLLVVLRSLAAQGTCVVFISHKLAEVLAVSDRVTVLRAGRVTGEVKTAETDKEELARLMVGRSVKLPRLDDEGPAESQPDKPVLRVSELEVNDERGLPRVRHVSFQVKSGEIVGVAGVDGNGQLELCEAILGLRRPSSGTVMLLGRNITGAAIADRLRAGMAYVPADRQRTALIADLSVRDNAILEVVGWPQFSRLGFTRRAATRRLAKTLISEYDIRCEGPEQATGSLSGGNQQKLVLARALFRDPSLVVAAQPTRGIDIGATARVHEALLAHRGRGAAILLVSTELDELFSLSDRILVIFNGRIMGERHRSEISREEIGLMMAGQAQ